MDNDTKTRPNPHDSQYGLTRDLTAPFKQNQVVLTAPGYEDWRVTDFFTLDDQGSGYKYYNIIWCMLMSPIACFIFYSAAFFHNVVCI